MILHLAISLPDAAALLLSLALKGAVLLSVAALLALVMYRASAASRHSVWAIALTMVLALPVLLTSLPAWQVPVNLGLAEAGVEASTGAFGLPSPALVPLSAAPPAGDALSQAATSPPGQASVAEPAAAHAPAGGLAAGIASYTDGSFVRAQAEKLYAHVVGAMPAPFRSPGGWIVLFWFFGAVFVASRWIAAFVSARRLVQTAAPVVDGAWLAMHERVCRTLGLGDSVALYQSDRLAVPIAWSFGSPAVVLPGDADDWSAERREVVLMHEVAHIVRRDGATQMIAQAAVVLHWFNPLAWFAYGRLLLEREHACDDMVLAQGTRASVYAEHLLEIARRFRQESLALLAVAPMARRCGLEGRLRAILDPSTSRADARPTVVGAVATGAILLALPLAAFQPVSAPAEQSRQDMRLVEMGAPLAPAGQTATEVNDWTWSGRVADGGFVEVYGTNGAIEFRQGSGRTVRVTGTPRRLAEGDARLVVNEQRDGVVICVVHRGQSGCEPGSGPSGRARGSNRGSVKLEVVLPEGVRLVARTVNGAITGESITGPIDARTTNGAVDVASRRGDVTARTTNGAVTVAANGRVTAQTTNGRIKAHLASTRWQGASRLATTNGGIELLLPAGADVDLDARTRNGSITSDLPIEISRRRGAGTSASGRLGRGGRSIELRTNNGSVQIRREGSQPRGDGASGAHDSSDRNSGHLEEEVLRHAEAATEALHAADIGLEAAELATMVSETVLEALLDRGSIEKIVESALEGLDAASLQAEIRSSMQADKVDMQQIREEIRQALEEAREEIRQARMDIRR